MAILFKSHKKQQRLNKYQVGGAISSNYYAKSSYHPVEGPKYDPSALLAKYARQTTAEDKEDKDKKDTDKKPKSIVDSLKPEGLDNDNEYLTKRIAEVHEQMQYGLNNIKDFEKDERFYNLENEGIQLSGLVEQNKNHKAEYNEALKIMEANQGEDAFVYENGNFLVKAPILNDEGKLVDYKYEYKPAPEVWDEKGLPKFDLLTTKQYARDRNSDRKLIGNWDAITKIKDAVGVAKGVTTYLDPLLEDIGVTKGGNTTSVGGNIINGQVVKEYLDGKTGSSNAQGLTEVLNTLRQDLDPKFINALEAKAWMRPVKDEKAEGGLRVPNKGEVDLAVNQFIASQVWKRLATEDITNTIRKVDLTATENLYNTGNTSGTTVEISPYTQEAGGLGSPRTTTLEIPHSDKKKSSLYTFYGNNAPRFAADLVPEKTLAGNTKFKLLTPVDQSFLSDGTQVTERIKFGGVGPIKLIDMMMPVSGSDVTIMVVPVLKNNIYNKEGKLYKKKGAVATAEWVPRMTKELAAVKDKYSGSDAEEARNAIVRKYDKMANGSIEMKLVAKYKVAYNQKAANYTMHFGNAEEKRAAKTLATREYNGLGYGKNLDGERAGIWLKHFEENGTLDNTSDIPNGWSDASDPGDVKSIDIMSPIGTFMETSSAGGVNAYTMKYNLNYGSIVNNNAPSTFKTTTKTW